MVKAEMEFRGKGNWCSRTGGPGAGCRLRERETGREEPEPDRMGTAGVIASEGGPTDGHRGVDGRPVEDGLAVPERASQGRR